VIKKINAIKKLMHIYKFYEAVVPINYIKLIKQRLFDDRIIFN